MSKEEKKAINYLEFLSNEKCECKVCQNAKKQYKIILNLIEKQQNKISSLEKQIKLMQNCDLLEKQQKEIEDYKIKYVHLESDYQVLKDDLKDKRIAYVDTPEFEEKFINKDKIREKIKELEEDLKQETDYEIEGCIESSIDTLKELIEENNND